ncbi:MAG: acyl carrier protein [Bacteroidota bacterium]
MHDKIANFIIQEFHGGDPDLSIAPEDDLLTSNLLGSVDMMRLIAFLEEEYDFKVAPRDMTIENFITVGAMVKYLEQVKQA